ncbi:hypothetical protein N2152v2_006504 [Parachlorella kessleri]
MSEQQKPDSKGALLPEALPFFWAALDFTSTTQRLVVRAVVILFKQTGDAPILKQNKVKVDGQEKFAKLVEFLRKKLGREQVFVYLKEAFSPSLDERISVLFDAFGVDGRLVVNYALTPAWG